MTTLDTTDNAHWYAASTRSRQEKTVASRLYASGIECYLPMASEMRRWSDRRQLVHVPLFVGYVFVRIHAHAREELRVLTIPGVVRLIGNSKGASPIPNQQIEDLRRVLALNIPYDTTPFLQAGDRVRVVRGAFAGVEGNFVRAGSGDRLIVSIEMIQRAISVTVSKQDVESLFRHAA
jgi:transcription termination/antitermination protein NusG